MGAVTPELLTEMVAAVVQEVDPEQIYLFGSHARGDASDQSDLDILIVEREPFGPERSRRREAGRLWRLLARFGTAKDILVYSVDEVERRRHSRNHVIAHALREGKLLYERP